MSRPLSFIIVCSLIAVAITRSTALTARDGYASVQVMYRNPGRGDAGPVQYAQGGYEASYGRYDIDERAQAWTFHVEGAMVRSLVGKDLKRRYEFSGNQLIVTPSSPDEHWRVAWERY